MTATQQINDRLQAAIKALTQMNNEHALERAICARLMEEKDAEIARLTNLGIELLNLNNQLRECAQ